MKKIVSLTASVALILALMPNTLVFAEGYDTATVTDAEDDTDDGLASFVDLIIEETEIAAEQTDGEIPLTGDMTELTTGCYVVTGNVTITDRITVSGNVTLILEDGCNLNAEAGITVAEGNSLTISARSNGTGKLTVGSGYCMGNNNALLVPDGMAGIGGESGKSAGTITINGGNITVVAGGKDAAGIGGGTGGTGGTININGGTVKATSGEGVSNMYFEDGEDGSMNIIETYGGGAGIGGGLNASCGTINITGGIVTAGTAYASYGAAIGGGANANGGNINISGGRVSAEPGCSGAGIGGGAEGNGGNITISGEAVVTAKGCTDSAAIGGGKNGNGGNITIEGGTVSATGSWGSSGIGGGSMATSGNITIKGGTVEATGGSGAAGIGSGSGAGTANTSETIEISGGTVIATGGSYSAGIGGGASSEGGNIIISGGTVTAKSGGNAASGIGGGGSGNNAPVNEGTTFTTGENGEAVIITTSIGDEDYTANENISAIIITGDNSDEAVVYGNQTLESSLGVSNITVTKNATLTVSESVAKNSSIENTGTLVTKYDNGDETKVQILNDESGNKIGEVNTKYISDDNKSIEVTTDVDGKKINTVTTVYCDENREKPISIVTEDSEGNKETVTNEYDDAGTLTKTVAVDKDNNTTTTSYSSDGTKVVVKTDSDGNETERKEYYLSGAYKDYNFTPVLTAGDGSTYDTTSALKFRSDDDFVNFLSVKVDDKAIDSKNYVAEKGSIIVTLNKSYLDTLKLGTHTISIVSTNGEAKGTFTVTKTSAKDKTENATTENQTTENATTENQTTENATTEKSTTENITTEAQTTVVASDKTKLTSSNTDSSPDTGDAIGFILILSLMSITLTGLFYTTKIRRN